MDSRRYDRMWPVVLMRPVSTQTFRNNPMAMLAQRSDCRGYSLSGSFLQSASSMGVLFVRNW